MTQCVVIKMRYLDYDELKVFKGDDIKIQDSFYIHQPTLQNIYDYGEREFYSLVSILCSTPNDMCFQLDDIGVDFTQISCYELFYSIIIHSLPKEKTKILFGDLDFTQFEIKVDKQNQIYLEQTITSYQTVRSFFIFKKRIITEHKVIINDFIYEGLTQCLRDLFGLRKDERVPMNNARKQEMIEDARENYEYSKLLPYSSTLKNLISTLVNNSGFKYNHDEVWNMKIVPFMDSFRRICKVTNAILLLQSGYSGYGINLDKIDKKQLDWTGDL